MLEAASTTNGSRARLLPGTKLPLPDLVEEPARQAATTGRGDAGGSITVDTASASASASQRSSSLAPPQSVSPAPSWSTMQSTGNAPCNLPSTVHDEVADANDDDGSDSESYRSYSSAEMFDRDS